MSPEFDNATNPSRSDVTEQSSADSHSSGPDESTSDAAHSAGSTEGVAAAPARTPEPEESSVRSESVPPPAANAGASETPAPDSGLAAESKADPATAEAIVDMESEGDVNPDLGNIPDGEISAEAMSQLIEQYPTPGEKPAKGKNPAPKPKKAENEVVEGKVVTLNDLGVVVDIGGKKEGLIPASEFAEVALTVPPLSPGQTVEVEKLGEEKDGYCIVVVPTSAAPRHLEKN